MQRHALLDLVIDGGLASIPLDDCGLLLEFRGLAFDGTCGIRGPACS